MISIYRNDRGDRSKQPVYFNEHNVDDSSQNDPASIDEVVIYTSKDGDCVCGRLLQGYSSIVFRGGIIRTRKFEITKQSTGISGAWVILKETSQLAGIVYAGYSHGQYLHMIPADEMFSDIKTFLGASTVKVASKSEIQAVMADVASRPEPSPSKDPNLEPDGRPTAPSPFPHLEDYSNSYKARTIVRVIVRNADGTDGEAVLTIAFDETIKKNLEIIPLSPTISLLDSHGISYTAYSKVNLTVRGTDNISFTAEFYVSHSESRAPEGNFHILMAKDWARRFSSLDKKGAVPYYGQGAPTVIHGSSAGE
ncbi:hypothetical protein BDV19DRAFT_388963 [Aspergillus venezuelensis]